jgi:acyl-coenzyme A thioesterase PaaI-like protein
VSDDPIGWLREPEEGWVEVEGQDAIVRHTFLSGEAGPLTVRYFRTGDRSVRAKAVFGPRTQGPPGFAHGGSQAALLDEAMGFAVWCSGRVAVSAELHVHYRTMLPIPQRCVAEALVDRADGRKLWTRARLRSPGGDTLYAEAEGIFVEVSDQP